MYLLVAHNQSFALRLPLVNLSSLFPLLQGGAAAEAQAQQQGEQGEGVTMTRTAMFRVEDDASGVYVDVEAQ